MTTVGGAAATAPTRRAAVGPLAVFLAAGAMFLASQYLARGNRGETMEFLSPADTVFYTVTFGFAVLGLYSLTLRPHHLTGRLLLASGTAFAAALLTHELAVRALLLDGQANRLGWIAAWAYPWLIPLAFGLALLAPLTWPQGAAPAGWRGGLFRTCAVATGVFAVAQLLQPDTLDGLPPGVTIRNPWGVADAGSITAAATSVSVVVLVAGGLIGLVDLLQRAVRVRRRVLLLAGMVALFVLASVASLALRPLLGDGGWLLLIASVAVLGIVALAVTTTRAQQRQRAAEESRQALVREREDERRRLRADLHDGLGPLLAALRLELDRPGTGVTNEHARDLVAESIAEVRRISRNLRPVSLDDLGLAGALRKQAEAITAPGGPRITVHTAPESLPTLPASVELAAYRIANEAMTNAARHSGAATCDVLLNVAEDGRSQSLTVDVRDDGKGMDGAVDGVGLRSMRQRTEELGGRFVMRRSGRGARLVATLPWSPADPA